MWHYEAELPVFPFPALAVASWASCHGCYWAPGAATPLYIDEVQTAASRAPSPIRRNPPCHAVAAVGDGDSDRNHCSQMRWEKRRRRRSRRASKLAIVGRASEKQQTVRRLQQRLKLLRNKWIIISSFQSQFSLTSKMA